jgi:transforming growth factor-beta-induced protein
MMIKIPRVATLVIFALLCCGAVALTEFPSDSPSDTPSDSPSDVPSDIPSGSPSDIPSDIPSGSPSDVPSLVPTESTSPSTLPTLVPTSGPSSSPTTSPSGEPSAGPTTSPSGKPSAGPSGEPSKLPSLPPTFDPNTVAGFLLNDPDLAMVTVAFERAGFIEPLANPAGSFTVFAAKDSAFSAVPPVYIALLFDNDNFIPHLRNLLMHNMLPVKRLAADFVDNVNATGLSGESFLVRQNPLRVNGIVIEDADNEVMNGVVHIMDDVLAPSWVFYSLQRRIAEDADLSILFSLMNIIGLDISSLGEFTFLAPVNSAFNDETVAFLLDDTNKEILAKVLLYLIVPGVFTTNKLVPSRLDTFEGGFVTVSTNNEVIRFNGAGVVKADILTNNGVLHKMNTLLLYTSGVRGDTILDFVADNTEMSTLFGAIQRSGFDVALAQDASLTLFAPTNDAFNLLPAAIFRQLFFNDNFIPHLQVTLLYHLLGGELFSNAFEDGTFFRTLSSEVVQIGTSPLSVNARPLVVADNDVSNGVVHTVAGVLAPSWIFYPLSKRVVDNANLSTLLELMVLAGLALSGAGAYTLLAPTNTAFSTNAGLVEQLKNNENLRTVFLGKHLIQGVFMTFQLGVGLELPNFIGTVVTVTSTEPLLLDGTAGFVKSDVLANNGVIHTIDTVLDPDV